jgi:hypothetical protein
MINRKLILYVTVIGQVFEMSFTFAEFVSSLEISKFLFSSRDLARGFSGYCKSLSRRLL